MLGHAEIIEQLVRSAFANVTGSGKLGDRVIDPALSAVLACAG